MRLRTWMVAVAFVTSAFAPLAGAHGQGPQFASMATGGPLGTPPFSGDGCPSCQSGGIGSSGLNALHAASAPMGPMGGPYPGGPMGGPMGGGPLPGGDPGALPPGTMPWPQISPYEHAMEQHRIKDGLWYRDVSNGGCDYYAQLGATVLQVRKPNRFRTTVGDPFISAGDPSIASTVLFQDSSTDPQFHDRLKSTPGMRAIFGWVEPWGSGVEFNAWFTPENSGLYSRGDKVNVGTTHSLPLDNGAGGVLVPFDQFFGIRFSSVYAGAGVNWFTNDVWPRPQVRFRVSPGFRYLYIGEEFNVEGINSTGVAGPFTSVINSKTQSNLFGPQIGIDYGFGGDTLEFKGRSKFGLLINITEYQLSGRGVGDGIGNPSFNPGLTFDGGETHTHFSPMFEQQLGFDMDVIGIIPVLKNCSWLDNAKIHVGYSVVLLWEVARPQYNIAYFGQPLTPRLRSNLAAQRTQWYTHGWDFALRWEW